MQYLPCSTCRDVQHVPGISLLQRIEINGALDTREVSRISFQFALGLEAAHRQGIVHRDVKPANVILESAADRSVRIGWFALGGLHGSPSFSSRHIVWRRQSSLPIRTTPDSRDQSRYRRLDVRSEDLIDEEDGIERVLFCDSVPRSDNSTLDLQRGNITVGRRNGIVNAVGHLLIRMQADIAATV